MNGHHRVDGDGNGDGEGGDNNNDDNDNGQQQQQNEQRSNQIPLPLLSRFNLTTPTNHYLHQHSSNNSIETQIGSMPPLHPDANPESNGSNKPAPLHQRRRQSAPTTLTIPFS